MHLSEFVGRSVSKMECKAELSGGVRSPIAKRGLRSWAKPAQFTPEANQPGNAIVETTAEIVCEVCSPPRIAADESLLRSHTRTSKGINADTICQIELITHARSYKHRS